MSEIRKASKKQISIASGFLLMLISVCLIINIGYPIRALSFGPFYLFGAGSYAFYLLLYIEGIFLVGKKKLIPLRPIRKTFGLLISFIGACMILSIIGWEGGTVKTAFVDDYHSLFATYLGGNYITCPIEELFKHTINFGGGILGYSLIGVLNGFLFSWAGLLFGILILTLGLFLLTFPLIKRFVKFVKNKSSKKAEKEARKGSTVESIHVVSKPQKEKIVNIDRIKNASIIDDNYRSEIAEARPIVSNPYTGTGNVSATYESNLRKAKFGRNGDSFLSEARRPGTLEPASFPGLKRLPKQEPIQEETQNQFEQLSLDFDAKHEDIVPPQEEQIRKPAPQIKEDDGIQTLFVGGNQEDEDDTSVDGPGILEEPEPEQFIEQEKSVQNTFTQPISMNNFTNVQKPEPEPVVEKKPEPVKRERVVWVAPDANLLDTYETAEASEKNRRTAEERSEIINAAFVDFRVGAKVENYTIGPSVTRYNIRNESNVLVREVNKVMDDIAIRLGGVSCRFEKLIEGQTTSGIEVPNTVITTVGFNEVFAALPDVKKHPLAFGFGKNIQGEITWADLNKCPHMLVSGTTGSGKSIFVNSIITTLIMRNSPDDMKLVLVDPKKVEMARYADMPHLLCPIITEAEEAKLLVDKLVEEMENRYALFASSNGATDIGEYNEDCEITGKDPLPYIVVILDEYADIVDNCKEISMPVVTLAAKARACGIHLIIATQRPSTNVVTGVIKANLPTHVALMTGSYIDSMTIIGEGGAEKLLGKGDMLVQSPLVSRVGVVRLQGCFISRKEAIRVVTDLKERYQTFYEDKYVGLLEKSKKEAESFASTPEFQISQENSEEAKYQSIKEWVMTQQFMSISRIQRECGVGFNRAGRFFLKLQSEGVVDTSTDGNKGCRVLVNDDFGNDDDNIPVSVEQTSFGED